MKREVVKTADGSSSLFIEALDEHYHSIHGAIQESKHVFIEAGLQYFKNEKSLKILEIGFGTGLNALMTVLENKQLKIPIYYTGIEAFPLTDREIAALNYSELLENDAIRLFFNDIHACEWENEAILSADFILLKLKTKIEDFEPILNKYDIIYFDAFAPSAQPHLWELAIFEKMYRALRPGGILTTYCAKGVVKRRLKEAGFKVESLPGPKGKREMTRAVKLKI